MGFEVYPFWQNVTKNIEIVESPEITQWGHSYIPSHSENKTVSSLIKKRKKKTSKSFEQHIKGNMD